MAIRQFFHARITCSSQLRVVQSDLHAVLRCQSFCYISNANVSYSFNDGWTLRGRRHEAAIPANPTIKEGGWVPGGWWPT